MRNIDVWYARLDVASIRDQLGARLVRQADEALAVERCQRADERQHSRTQQAVSQRRRRAPDRRQSSAGHPDRGRSARRGAGTPRGRRAAHDRHVPPYAPARPAPASSRATATCTLHARSSASAASAPEPGSCFSSAATRAIRCSSSSRKRRPRCSSRSSARASIAQHGQRVVEGQRMMQAAPDILLGWERVDTIDGRRATSTSASSGTRRGRRRSS